MTLLLLAIATALSQTVVGFESGPVRPLALGSDGRVWVTNLPDGRLEALDPATGTTVASIPVGLDPVAVAVDGDRAWVVDHVSDSVSVVDLSTEQVVAVLPVGDGPEDVVFAGTLF